MTRQKKYVTESDDKGYYSLYSAAINGARILDVIDRSTGEIIESIVESGRPENTRKQRKRKLDQYAVMVFDKVTNAIVTGEVQGYEIIVLMASISRITYQDNWVVDTSTGAKMSILAFTKSANLDRNTATEALKALEYKGFIVIEKFNGKSYGIRVMKDVAYRGSI